MKIQVYSAITGERDEPRDDVLTFGSFDKFKKPVMNAKIYKVLPHLFLDTDYSIWIDGSVTLKVEPEVLIALLEEKEIGVFTHPDRTNILEEADVCINWELGDPEIINKQLDRYRKRQFDLDNSGLGACYIVVRKHTPEINTLNEKWWAEICRGSVRDQISFPYVYKDKVKYFIKPNSNDNEYFKRKGHKK